VRLLKVGSGICVAAIVLVAVYSFADSQFSSGPTAGTSATPLPARLDFQIIIPRVIYMQVGTGTIGAANATIDLINFAQTPALIGNSVPLAGTGGDLVSGSVTIRAYGNNGNMSLNSITTGPMNNGNVAQTIPWSSIVVTPSALASTTSGFANGAIAHPAFNLGASGGVGTAVTLAAANNVVRQEGKWTYSYANTAVPAAGTYGGAGGLNSGRVSYTVSMP